MIAGRHTRRWLGGAVAGTLALVAAPAFAKRIALEPDDMALGSPKARVTVVEYASAGCPHCAEWSNDVFPAFKAKFIDTGKVRFVLRECITGDPDLAAAGFMIARCAGRSKYFDVLENVFKHQDEIRQSPAAGQSLLHDIGISAGLSDVAYQACLADKAGFDAVQARSQRHADVDKVDSTPTFLVNGKRIEGVTSLDALAAAIAAARRRA